MKKKYIIDLNPDCVEGEYLRIPARIAGEEQWLVTKAALTPYTEPDLEQVRKEGFQEGKKQAKVQAELDVCHDIEKVAKENYKAGLSDAWEAARKIALTEGLDINGMYVVFGTENPEPIFREYSANECIEKIRQYEQGKEMDGLRQNIQAIVDKCGYSLDEIAAVLEKMRGSEQDG